MRRWEAATGARRVRAVAGNEDQTQFSPYVDLDVHRQSVSFCRERPEGAIVREGKVAAQRPALLEWAQSLRETPWCGGLEATICSSWIYYLLQPYAAELKMAHPAQLKAITTAKRKTDCLDARTLADLLRCDLPARIGGRGQARPNLSSAQCLSANYAD